MNDSLGGLFCPPYCSAFALGGLLLNTVQQETVISPILAKCTGAPNDWNINCDNSPGRGATSRV